MTSKLLHRKHVLYKSFRIDDLRKHKHFQCWKVRHLDLEGYIMVDFKSLKSAKEFIDKAKK